MCVCVSVCVMVELRCVSVYDVMVELRCVCVSV